MLRKACLAGSLAVFTVASCGGDSTGSPAAGSASGSGAAATAAPSAPAFVENPTSPGVHRTGENSYMVVMQASEGGFNPSEVRVPVGAEITFRVRSTDNPHGFHIIGPAARLSAIPEAHRDLVHVFDSVRVHDFFCDEYCGGGHDSMRGRIIVE